MELVDRAAQQRHHDTVDPHQPARWLSDVVLGGQDGLVNTVAVVLGVAAATADQRVVLVAGLAAALAEAVSMAAVAYTSRRAEADLFRAEEAREHRHIQAVPDLERDEIRSIYARKGFAEPMLGRIVDTITRDKAVWVAVMMAEEHGLVGIDGRAPWRAALVVGLASLIGALTPLAPFLLLSSRLAVPAALLVSASALFAFGVYKARITLGHPLKSGLELAAIGTAAAALGYGIGAMLHA